MLTKNDLSQIRGVVQEETRKIVQEEVAPIKKDIETLKKDVKKIDKKLDKTIDFFDKESLELRTRVKRVENQLGLGPVI